MTRNDKNELQEPIILFAIVDGPKTSEGPLLAPERIKGGLTADRNIATDHARMRAINSPHDIFRVLELTVTSVREIPVPVKTPQSS